MEKSDLLIRSTGLDDLAKCQWPALAEQYNRALRATVAYILENFNVHGIIVSGSIIRGNPNSGSDFDTYVIHTKPERQRVQKVFHGVPSEIFINPPAAIRSYFRNEQKGGRPCTAHMLTTGFVTLDRHPIVQILLSEAAEAMSKRPNLSAQELTFRRYGAADLYENAVDIAHSDSANASLILYKAVEQIIEYFFLDANQWVPRYKEVLVALSEDKPELGALAYQFYNEADLTKKFQIAEGLAQQILGETGFFEWETTPQPFSED